jgi:hypothetical protein
MGHIVEAKSTTSDKQRFIPDKQYIDQVLWYMHFFGNALGATAEIAYAIRDTQEIISFPITYDAERVEALIRWAERVSAAVRSGQPLSRPEYMIAERFPCSWGSGRCQYFEHCYRTTEDVNEAVTFEEL